MMCYDLRLLAWRQWMRGDSVEGGFQLCAAPQAIFDPHRYSHAYQLLFRSPCQLCARFVDPSAATDQDLINALLEIGLVRVGGPERPFVSCTRCFFENKSKQ